MDRIQPMEFLVSSLVLKSNTSAFCFDRCMKREQMDKEITREQEHCLGTSAYR
jgi:hypothetical protein